MSHILRIPVQHAADLFDSEADLLGTSYWEYDEDVENGAVVHLTAAAVTALRDAGRITTWEDGIDRIRFGRADFWCPKTAAR
jgi:hypothetical protein